MTQAAPTMHAAGRQFLFLQGLAGPFFRLLGDALAARGHGVHRVNFHGGDWLFWRRSGAVNYRGGLAGWPDYLKGLLAGRAITDIVLFGDCRPLHGAARAIAAQMRVQVHVFEEGYMRPDWVTLEAGGVNGLSSLPRDPQYYLDTAATLPPPAPHDAADVGVPTSFARRAREDLAYNISAMLLRPFFPGYVSHRPWHPVVEYAGWLRRLAGQKAAARRSNAVRGRLERTGRPFMVFPLQLDCDYQIRMHSPYPGMEAAITEVLTSFARHAPAGLDLIVKGHPLDNGLRDWRAETLAIAARLGLAGRVLFLEDGNIDLLVRAARGVVTVNSTTGTLSAARGVPTISLGRAVYDIPGVTHQDGLDAFWASPAPPDPQVFDALRRVLVHRCMIRGGFFSDEGLQMLVGGAVARLEATARPAPRPVAAEAPRPVRAGPPMMAAAKG